MIAALSVVVMPKKMFAMVICASAWLVPVGAIPQSFDRTEIGIFHAVRRQPNALARYEYLTQRMPQLSAADQLIIGQFRAFALDELGLYNEAVLSFPLQSMQPADLVLPDRAAWKRADAADVITQLAVDRHIVMINEAHHNAHTRVLTLALLPRLRALGFSYFAAEALGDDDPGLMQRGYPVRESGTEYLREPLYGEIVREAIRLGFTLIPYDSSSNDLQTRDTTQAENLFRKVFASDPHARLFVDAGYAHIDKARGRLGEILPMATQLAKLSGFEPLSIDQTQFLEHSLGGSDDYHVLTGRFPTRSAEVLLNRTSDAPWSAQPKLYDLSVILPPVLNVNSFGNGLKIAAGDAQPRNVRDTTELAPDLLIALNDMQRPGWLTLDGERVAFPINTDLCRNRLPCVVEAHYLGEPDDATAADRYAFFEPYSRSKLYLRPGRYRLRAWNAAGKTLSGKIIDVAQR